MSKKRQNNKQLPPVITISISPGELFDRATILALKEKHIAGTKKHANVRVQRVILLPYEKLLLKAFPHVRTHVRTLARVNNILWKAEDTIRELSKKNNTGVRFIKTARLIHITNDKRTHLKRSINQICKSSLHEEKTYSAINRTRTRL